MPNAEAVPLLPLPIGHGNGNGNCNIVAMAMVISGFWFFATRGSPYRW